ncbi:FMN adenylyltransferase /riboflavin kinase [Pelagirhabdus alkalitolerans]|uniref:Riboflavin biosynthesis protein n=1 Tax=Pelagirhabdus alkalitolerans TaxID=1612202 RepID=A0A1G6H4R6_9BACI|nr:bifunctional riboflavin kinase/FAD synthetase [Pelagirhabdus alkalitolerans]SDB89088.1 FMN adenylyltransferase /riboflavin kinase [Pelagirhabdus alkalitolerans]
MRTIHLSYPDHLHVDHLESSVCAIGFFDGIHKGHQHVIQTAKDVAQKSNKKLAVMTFNPHPLSVISNGKKAVSYLTTLTQKEAILNDLGVDLLYVVDFNHELARLSAESFIDTFIIQLDITHLVCGFDFTYGHKGKGNVSTLPEHANERFSLTVVEKYSEDNEKVSSSWIRQKLQAGEMQQVKHLLTRPLMTTGKVVHGYKRGRLIGYPTANIAIEKNQALPRTGVYYVTVKIDGKEIHGMANLGYNPTFQDDDLNQFIKLEVHLLDFDGHLYDQTLTVSWHEFVRPEYKFDHVDQLVERIKQDEQEIRQIFS